MRRRGPTAATRTGAGHRVTRGTSPTFAAAAARRYPSVHLWMIWGEPTRPGELPPDHQARCPVQLNRAQQVAPHIYARMLDAAYGALKRVSRRNLVIGGCTYTTGLLDPLQWIENLTPARWPTAAHGHVRPQSVQLQGAELLRRPSPFGEVQFSDLHELARWIDRYIAYRASRCSCPSGRSRPLLTRSSTSGSTPSVAAQWISDALALSRAVETDLRARLGPCLRRSAAQRRWAAHRPGGAQAGLLGVRARLNAGTGVSPDPGASCRF